jgi:hypothetical protein
MAGQMVVTADALTQVTLTGVQMAVLPESYTAFALRL